MKEKQRKYNEAFNYIASMVERCTNGKLGAPEALVQALADTPKRAADLIGWFAIFDDEFVTIPGKTHATNNFDDNVDYEKVKKALRLLYSDLKVENNKVLAGEYMTNAVLQNEQGFKTLVEFFSDIYFSSFGKRAKAIDNDE